MIGMLSGCGGDCSSELLSSQTSQDHRTEAAFFKKNCGATSGYVYELRVGQSTVEPLSRGLALRFDNDHQTDWPIDDRGLINLKWDDKSKLEVSLTQRVRVFKEEASIGGTTIVYHFKPATSHL